MGGTKPCRGGGKTMGDKATGGTKPCGGTKPHGDKAMQGEKGGRGGQRGIGRGTVTESSDVVRDMKKRRILQVVTQAMHLMMAKLNFGFFNEKIFTRDPLIEKLMIYFFEICTRYQSNKKHCWYQGTFSCVQHFSMKMVFNSVNILVFGLSNSGNIWFCRFVLCAR